jgi:hypothetical protein
MQFANQIPEGVLVDPGAPQQIIASNEKRGPNARVTRFPTSNP